MYKLLSVLLFCCLTTIPSKSFSQDTIPKHKNALATQIGTLGFGVEYARKLSTKTSLRARASFLNFSDYVIEDFELDGENFDITSNIESQIFDVVLEYLPFRNSSFKLVGGIGYISRTELDIDIAYDDEIIVGDITFTNDELGGFTTNTKWSGIAPYFGVGFGRAIPKNRLGISFELGAFYVNNPEVNFTARGLLTPSGDENADLIKEAFEDAKFIPNLNIKLAYKF